ncbi:hypothetical protein AJ79_06892 [Helicocarpus griseus UAMH5409]|uniref:Cell wall mannoprotein n=1 Tax=Helicocarpus griseus UAMH5409 TaxID=1447875 RepID=A0A2B7X7G4_9EURO|nr:hypothetical protein AJ79_06892 [Helicocarpus griseus UAMH5409]
MKTQQLLQVLLSVTLASSRPLPHRSIASRLHTREVPQELSHFKFLSSVQDSLQLDNPNEIVDPVFGLLGNEAGAEGAGLIEDIDCLQQATADQAFTNAKAAGDIQGMTDALIYRALERNTGSVGLASVLCESLEAVNPEIAAITQHQDPASEGAAELNRQIALDLAAQIASIGGDPLQAIDSGTFEPGDVNDPTGAGNTCDTEGDEEGCIFTLNLLVPDVSEDEINSAVAEAGIDVEVAAAGADALADECTAELAAGDDEAAVANATATAGVAAAVATDEVEADQVASSSSSADVLGLANLDLGLCRGASPLIAFGGSSYAPVDLGVFSHNSVDSINALTSFICDTLSSTCLANSDVVEACVLGQALAAQQTGIAAANAFNNAILLLDV